MTRLLSSLLLLLCCVIVASSSKAQPAPVDPPATNQPAAEQPADADHQPHPGIAIYRANYCGICHELPAAETHGAFGPTHVGMGTTAAQRIQGPSYGGQATTPAEYLAESIIEPTAFLVPGYATSAHPMPSFAHLPKADISALVELLLAQ